jgi:hypothetical protein
MRELLNHPVLLRLFEVIDRRSENRMNEFGMLAQAFEFCKINGVAGDYFEFGVWRGKTFGYARTMARRYGYGPIKYRAFDSFAGLPPVDSSDFEIWHEGQFACSRNEFEAVLRRKGFRPEDYEIVEGFYNKSLTPDLSEALVERGVKASVVYIDCDLYESTRAALRFIGPFLQDGTVICFDDFYNYRGNSDFGEQKAFREFREAHPKQAFLDYMAYSPLGMSFVCSMKS